MFENFFNKYRGAKCTVFLIVAILFIIFITKIKDIAILFFASFVIACSLNPLVDKLTNKLKRGAAAAIVLSLTVLILSAFFIPIIVMAGHEIKAFVAHIPQYIDYIKEFILNTPIINKSQLAQIDIGDFISSTSGILRAESSIPSTTRTARISPSPIPTESRTATSTPTPMRFKENASLTRNSPTTN